MKRTLVVAAALSLLVSTKSFAGVIYNSSSEITQMTNLDVVAQWYTPTAESRFFDVDLVYGTFVEVFGGSALPAGWIINTLSLATVASLAFGDALDAALIPSTQRFEGNTSEVYVPYFAGDASSAVQGCVSCVATRMVYHWPAPFDLGWHDSFGTPFFGLDVARTWAIFTDHEEASSSVPAPPAPWLTAAGILAFMGRRRSIRNN